MTTVTTASTITKRSMKAIAIAALIGIMTFSGFSFQRQALNANLVSVYASQQQATATTSDTDTIKVTINGVPVTFTDQQPVIIDGRTLVPIRCVFEAIGFVPQWVPETQTVNLFKDENVMLSITIGNSTFGVGFAVNGRLTPPVALDVPAQLINDRTMLPIRLPLEAVGYLVEWDGITNTVAITGSGIASNDRDTNNNTDYPQQPSTSEQPQQPKQPPVQQPPTNQDNASSLTNDVIQGLFTSEELLVLITNAPSREETRSAFTMPADRRVTDAELGAWIVEYHAMGGMNAFELEVVMLVNEFRTSYGLPAFEICHLTSMAARFHSQDMGDNDFFSHVSPTHWGGNDRRDMFGGPYGAGENIGGGRSTPEMLVNSWINSSGHRNRLLSEVRYVGVGQADVGRGVLKLAHYTRNR